MATLGNTQVTSHNLGQPSPLANGLQIEVWQVAGGSVDDTSVITPKWGRFVVSVVCPQATHNASTLGTSTNVTLTLTASAATSVVFDAWVLVKT